MFQFFFTVFNLTFAIFGHDEFCQITYIADKAERDFFAGSR